MDIYWYLIPRDGPYPWAKQGRRDVDFDYLAQIARAVDHLGYNGALLAIGGGAHDAWGLGSALIPLTRRMKFIVAVHPGITAPLMLAQQAATFDQFSGGRLIINIVTGESRAMVPYGVTLAHDERYALTDEYWAAWKELMTGETVSFDGNYVRFRDAKLGLPPVQKPHPTLFFAGSSEPALNVAAKHADTYLTWGEPPPLAAETIAEVRRRAERLGRTVKFGIRLNLIVRETKEEAWAAAQWLYEHMDHEAIAFTRARNEQAEAVGQSRMNALIYGRPHRHARDLEIYPDLWAGFGLIRNGPGTAVVGDPETVAARLLEYRDTGFDTFIVSGQPLLEEAYRVADLLLPRLPLGQARPATSNFVAGPSVAVARG
jgi:alkanesulfonate monooxygenase